MIRKIAAYIKGKSVKQRIYIGIVLVVMVTLIVFTIKANFIDAPTADSSADTSSLPSFHISLVDVGVLLAVVTAYLIHKYRELKKQRRM